MLLSQAAPSLGTTGLSLAAAAGAGLQALQLHRVMPQLSRGLTSSSSTTPTTPSTQQQQTGKSVGASDELLSKLKDKELLRTCGFLGGKWSEASNGATYDVSSSTQHTRGREQPTETRPCRRPSVVVTGHT